MIYQIDTIHRRRGFNKSSDELHSSNHLIAPIDVKTELSLGHSRITLYQFNEVAHSEYFYIITLGVIYYEHDKTVIYSYFL